MNASKNVKWVRLGDLIEPLERRNTNKEFDISSVRGISNTKEIMATKADVDEKVIHKFYVIRHGEFIYNPRTTRMGEKVGLGYNNTESTFLFSFNNLAFKIKDSSQNLIIPDYLFLNFKREHFDRFARTNSWGSATELFLFSDLCTYLIPLPSIEVQQELVNLYNGLKALAEQNEALIEPLSKACEAMVVDCKNKYPEIMLGDYIDIYHEKNSDCLITLEQGINIDKVFITPQRSNSDLSSRIIVRRGQFAYCTQLNNENVAIAYREDEDCVVSPVYNTFAIKKSYKDKLLPKYLFLWLRRREFGRYVYWKSVGSAYEFLQEENLCEYKIPLPPLEVQQSIVDLYKCLEEAKKIAFEAREKLKTLCPALVQRAANS